MTVVTNLAERATEASGSGPVIAVRGAAVTLGGRTILQDVDLEVQAGEFLAILGPNGSGKSTLLKAILGLLRLSAGSIEVFGEATRRGQPDIGYVPQRRHFESDVRIRAREIVRFGLDGGKWGVPLPLLHRNRAREMAERVQEVIESVGAAAYADRPIGELSGGEQQRILIAQALVSRPKALALDEPLDSLDIANQEAIAAIVKRIARETKTAVLLVAHDVNPILSAIDTVVYMAHGHVAVGKPADVITTETLSRLYDAPVEVLRASDGSIVVVGRSPAEEVSYHAHAHHGER